MATSTSHMQQLRTGWHVFRLGDVGEIVSGVTLGRSQPAGPTRPVPYLRVANVKDSYLALDDVHEIEVTDVEFQRWQLREGDLLLTEGGDPDKLGRGAVWSGQLPECIHQNHIFRVRLDPAVVLPEFASAEIASPYGKSYFLRHANQTTGIATINQKILAAFPLQAPRIAEQRRMLAVLNEQVTMVDRARAAAEMRLEAAKALPRALLQVAFRESRSSGWPVRRLGEVCRLLPSRSITADGDKPVVAITTACLTENGFDSAGVKQARMMSTDASESAVSPGEILVARSNTPELVGRTAVFAGEPAGAVASDLTVRIEAGPKLLPPFVGAYLSYLYTTGYWRVRAGGASGSMKKITRSQLEAQPLPVPAIPEQVAVLESLGKGLSDAGSALRAAQQEVNAIGALPGVLLRRTFSRGL